MLIVLAGLPGVGKSTVARALALRLGATWLRIDVIEQALRNSGQKIWAEGYAVAEALAASNLFGGRFVVADCVNPVAASRAAFRAVADQTKVDICEIELICSDPIEHRRRVETRPAEIPGLTPPDWPAVQAITYEPWESERLVLDTAGLTVEAAVAAILARCQVTAPHRPVAGP